MFKFDVVPACRYPRLTQARGWSGIGHHNVVYRNGRTMVGRPIGQIGAHIERHDWWRLYLRRPGRKNAEAYAYPGAAPSML